jgi:epoxyqueuosine reductase QueG
MLNIYEEEINNISNKEFKRKYREKAFSWRGRKIIERNLNILKDKSSDQ